MVSYEFRFPRRMRITLWINKEMEREKLLPPFSAPLTLMAGHVETLNLKQVLRKIWMEAREGVRNFCLRCFFLWSSKVKGASFNRNATFQMFECLRVTRGCGTTPLIGKSRLSQIHAGLFGNIKGLLRSDDVTSSSEGQRFFLWEE